PTRRGDRTAALAVLVAPAQAVVPKVLPVGGDEDRLAIDHALESEVAHALGLRGRPSPWVPAKDQPVGLVRVVIIGDEQDVLSHRAADVDAGAPAAEPRGAAAA